MWLFCRFFFWLLSFFLLSCQRNFLCLSHCRKSLCCDIFCRYLFWFFSKNRCLRFFILTFICVFFRGFCHSILRCFFNRLSFLFLLFLCFLRLNHRMLICFLLAVVFLLLKRCQRLILHLKLHRFINVFTFAEPQNQIITFLQTLCRHTGLIIQTC